MCRESLRLGRAINFATWSDGGAVVDAVFVHIPRHRFVLYARSDIEQKTHDG